MINAAVVVYHVGIVASGHWQFNKFGPVVIGCVLRTAWIINHGNTRRNINLYLRIFDE